MSNLYFMKVQIHHKDDAKLKKLEELIHKWTSKNFKPNDFGLNWLGNIVGNSDIGSVERGATNELPCRGIMIDFTSQDGYLDIEIEGKGTIALKMWLKLLEVYLPDAKLIYKADNCSDGYWTNDPDLAGKYIIDPYDMDETVEYNSEALEDDLRTLLQKLLETKECDIDALMTMFYDSDYSDKMNIAVWDFETTDRWN